MSKRRVCSCSFVFHLQGQNFWAFWGWEDNSWWPGSQPVPNTAPAAMPPMPGTAWLALVRRSTHLLHKKRCNFGTESERFLLCEFYLSKWMSASKWFSIGKTVVLLSPLLGVDIQASRCRWLLESVKSWRPQKTWLFWWFVGSQANRDWKSPAKFYFYEFQKSHVVFFVLMYRLG